MGYCVSCGSQLPSDANFCTKCGQAFSQARPTSLGKDAPGVLWILPIFLGLVGGVVASLIASIKYQPQGASYLVAGIVSSVIAFCCFLRRRLFRRIVQVTPGHTSKSHEIPRFSDDNWAVFATLPPMRATPLSVRCFTRRG